MNRALLGGLVGFLLVLASALTGYLVRDRVMVGTPGPAPARAAAGPALPETLQAAFVGVAHQLGPSVVNIGTVQRSKARRPTGPQPGGDDPFLQDFFKQFFGTDTPGQRPEFRQPSLGSGVIIDPKGVVRWKFVEVDYNKRASNEQIRRELAKIK